jgi:hypothetical protein
VIVNGKGYGPACARAVREPDLLTQPRKRVTTGGSRQRKKPANQPELFQEAVR